MVKIKRYEISVEGLNPWIILGEITKLGEKKLKLFKDNKISDRKFLNNCFTRQSTCPCVAQKDILELYDIKIFEVKKRKFRLGEKTQKWGIELITETVFTSRHVFIEIEQKKIFFYEFKNVYDVLVDLKANKQNHQRSCNYEIKNFSIKISGLTFFNGPETVRLDDLSNICRSLGRNVRIFELQSLKPLRMRLFYEFENVSTEKEGGLVFLIDKIDITNQSQILELYLIYDKNVITSQSFICNRKNCLYETMDKNNFYRHSQICVTRKQEIVPVLKSYGTTMNQIYEAVELGFLPKSFLGFRKSRISELIYFLQVHRVFSNLRYRDD